MEEKSNDIDTLFANLATRQFLDSIISQIESPTTNTDLASNVNWLHEQEKDKRNSMFRCNICLKDSLSHKRNRLGLSGNDGLVKNNDWLKRGIGFRNFKRMIKNYELLQSHCKN